MQMYVSKGAIRGRVVPFVFFIVTIHPKETEHFRRIYNDG